MAIPEIPAIMLPLLQLAADNDILRFRDAVDLVAERLRLTETERLEVAPDGRTQRLYYRVSFARGRLKKLGLLEDPARGQFRITELGRRFLRSKPSRVDLRSIRQISMGPATMLTTGRRIRRMCQLSHRRRPYRTPTRPCGKISQQTFSSQASSGFEAAVSRGVTGEAPPSGSDTTISAA